MLPFSQVTILGGGLLGGSLALALEAKNARVSAGLPAATRLWARREETAEAARGLGISATTDLHEAVNQADLIVLAVPVGNMRELVEKCLAAGLREDCLFTDVGSVKAMPHRSISPLLQATNHHFLGSHPMAGSEASGLNAADAGLFQNAACLLTDEEKSDETLRTSLEVFWQSVGCKTTWLGAEEHDALVARISHLPHVLAGSGARICLQQEWQGNFAGGGLRDTTRVAGGNPQMWSEILLENRSALLGPLRETLADLQELLLALEANAQHQVHDWLATAKQRRDTLNR